VRLWLIVLILSIAGCGSVSPYGRQSVVPRSRKPIIDAASNETPAGQLVSAEVPLPTDAPMPPDAPLPVVDEATQQPAGAVGLTLEEAIETALQNNPSLIALRQDEPVSRAALRVAGTYPHDPSVQVTVLPESRFDNGETGSVVNSVQIMQTLELAHQPRYRWQTGSAQWNRTRWSIVEAEARSVAETQRRFFAVLYQCKLHELRKALADLNEDLLGILRRRYDAGQASAADVALAEMEARSSRQQAELAETALQSARLDLQVYLGLDGDGPCVIAGDIEDWSWLSAEQALTASAGSPEPDAASGQIGADEVVGRLAAGRPDVQAARADLEAAVAECKLASASRVPNLEIGPVYERDEDKTVFWGVAAQMAIPVFGSKGTLALQRGTEVRQKQIALQQLTRRASMEVKAALSQYERGRRLVERFDTHGNEELARQVKAVEDLFEAGQADLLRVYAARSQAFQVRMDRLQALDTLARAASDLIESSGIGPQALPLLLERRP
jgi:cobalt-zinc-cadmium efflux system outer membrane protein